MTYKEFREQRSGSPVQEQPEYRNAFWQYLSTRSLSDLDVEEHRALSKGTTTAGGFLVPTDFYNQLIRSLRFMGNDGVAGDRDRDRLGRHDPGAGEHGARHGRVAG
jgi:hypothetical protein